MDLKERIDSKEAKIGIIGLGYVGLPLLIEFVDEKYTCLGFDIDEKKIVALKNKKTYIKHISQKRIEGIVDSGLFDATTDFSRIDEIEHDPLGKDESPGQFKVFLHAVRKYLESFHNRGEQCQDIVECEAGIGEDNALIR